MSYSDDLAAVNTYFRTQPIKPLPNGATNAEAFQIKDSFIRWYDNTLGWADKNFTGQEVWDEARTRRNQFNIALAPTPTAKEEIKDTLARGIDTEEMQGKPKAAYDRATGRVGTQVVKPTVAPSPSAMPDSKTPAPVGAVKRATLVVGTRGPDVDVWQKFVGISPTTGYYGEATAGKTKNWQIAWNNAHPADKLVVDGKVGEKTWARAFPQEATAATASAFAPAPAPIGSSTASLGPSPGPKPSSGSSGKKAAAPAPKPSSGAKKVVEQVKTGTKTAAVKTAGMLDVGGWPLWAKIGAGVTIVGGIAAALLGQHKNPRRLPARYSDND